MSKYSATINAFANDLYYQPEKLGLTPIYEHDFSKEKYEFDIRMVWEHTSGRRYTYRDIGCSCPTPFSEVESIHSLEVVSPDITDFRELDPGEY